MVAAAVVGGAAALGGAYLTSSAASDAADTQANAAGKASAQQKAMYDQTRADLQPYNTQGQNALTKAYDIAGKAPTFNFNPTQADIEATPGYQFNLAQGQRAAQNSAAARGLGISGASEKGAINYASGLADNTYQNLFNDAYNTYGAKLSGYKTNLAGYGDIAKLGENAAAQTGNNGATAATGIANTITSGASQQAGANIYGANALTSGLNGAANAYMGYKYYNSPNAGTVYDPSVGNTNVGSGLDWGRMGG